MWERELSQSISKIWVIYNLINKELISISVSFHWKFTNIISLKILRNFKYTGNYRIKMEIDWVYHSPLDEKNTSNTL